MMNSGTLINPRSEIRIPHFADARAGEVAREYLPVGGAARGRDVRARLAEAEAVAEARAPEDKGRARARDLEARAFEHAPTERAPDDDLEVPAAQPSPTLPFKLDQLRAPRRVAAHDPHAVEPRAHVAALVRLQGFQETRRRY